MSPAASERERAPFYEILLEGHPDRCRGLLAGLLIGAGSPGYLQECHEAGVKTPLGERVLGIVHLGGGCHVVADATARKLLQEHAEQLAAHAVQIREEKEIASARFEYHYHVYARQYGEQIRKLLDSLPKELEREGEAPKIDVDRKARGLEVYSPVHDYDEEGKGALSGSRVDLVIEARRILDEHPLVEAEPVELSLA